MTEHFLKDLQSQIGQQLKVTINNNRHTMLSVKWEPHCTKVSLHRMFLNAPKNVMEALTIYLKGCEKEIPKPIKAFIQAQIHQLNYSHLLDTSKLVEKGKIYDLRAVYNDINKVFFNEKLKLHITWFGSRDSRRKTRCTLGLYYDPLKLIKINRILDDPIVPQFVLDYVVYHEMLHEAFPAYIDERGKTRIHNPEFKKHEVMFPHYTQAQVWMKNNPLQLFLA